jgi:hypothetical protein
MTCPFYRVDKVVVERRRSLRDGLPAAEPPELPAPWCAHLHSPVSKFLATRIVGGADKLHCGGDLQCCDIPLTRGPKR